MLNEINTTERTCKPQDQKGFQGVESPNSGSIGLGDVINPGKGGSRAPLISSLIRGYPAPIAALRIEEISSRTIEGWLAWIDAACPFSDREIPGWKCLPARHELPPRKPHGEKENKEPYALRP